MTEAERNNTVRVLAKRNKCVFLLLSRLVDSRNDRLRIEEQEKKLE